MNHSKCRTCGKRHVTGPCPVKPERASADVLVVQADAGPQPQVVVSPVKEFLQDEVSADADEVNMGVSSPASARTARWRAANREQYNAYMKDYMRQRRGPN